MSKKLVSNLWGVFVCCLSLNTFAATDTISFNTDPFSGNFDTDNIHDVITSNFGTISFKGTESGTSTAFSSLDAAPIGGGGLIWAGTFNSDSSVGITMSSAAADLATANWLVFASDGREFDFVSFLVGDFSAFITDMRIYGYRDGAIVATQDVSFTANSYATQLKTLSTDFDNVDEVRFEQRTVGGYDSGYPGFDGVLLQDIVIQDPTTANAAPVTTLPTPPTVNEDDSNVAIADNINIVDDDAQTVTLTIMGGTASIGTGSVSFTTGDGTDDAFMVFSGTLININTALDAMTFTPTANLNGTNAGAIQIQTSDGNGGADDDTVPFDIVAVNDDPTNSGSLPSDIATTEDIAGNLDLSGLTLADVDSAASSVVMTLTASAGSLTASSSGGVTVAGSASSSMTLTGTIANIDAYLNTTSNIQYMGASNVNGNDAATIAVKINDGGNTGTGGGGDIALGTVNMDITAVNDAPTDITLSANNINESDTGTAADVGFLSSTDVEIDSFTYSRVSNGASGSGSCGVGNDADNASFQINTATLETAGAIAVGSYKVCLQTSDGSASFQEAFTITVVDDVAPAITAVTIPNGSHKVGDVVTATITVNSDTDNYTLGGSIDGTINNYTLGSLVKINDTTYEATFTINDFGTDVPAGSDVTVNFTLNDSSGNTSAAYTTAINKTADAIYANLPDINLTSSSGTIAEDGGSVTLTGTISGSLNNQWPSTITVNLAYTGTAAPVSDFTKSDSFVISALSSSGSTTVTGVADSHYDAASAESIIVDIDTLSLGSEGTTNQQTINIIDAESAPIVTLSTGSASIAENGGTSSITAALSNPTYADVTVNLAYSGSAATDGSDYATPSSSITINALSLNNSAATGITAVNDASADGDLDILIDVDSVIGGSATENGIQQRTVTIIDDEDSTAPTITFVSIANNAHKVGDEVTATITVSSDSDDYTTGGAITGTINNYTLGSLFKIDDSTYSAKFTITDGGIDVPAENDVAVSFTLNDSSGNTSAAFTTAISRTDDAIYANLPDINLTRSSATIAEDGGSATLTGTISGSLNNQWPSTITVNLAYTGTAAPITDFTKSDSFIINALSSSGSTTVTGVADTHYDAVSAESIVVDISSLSVGNEGGTNQQTVSITDAESAPTVTLSTGSASIAENGGTSSITAALSNPTYADVTVNLAYSGSAATDGSDYATPSSSITINALSLNNSAATGVTAINDASADGDLNILIDVASVIGGSATENAIQQQTVSIIDDDDLTPPTLTGSTPSHNAVNIAINNPVVSLTFNENVQAGTGNISLILLSDSSIVQALAIAGLDVSMVDEVITANFSTTVLPQGQYGVRIDNTAVTDLAGNAYAGLAEADLSFTTFNAVPASVDDIATVNEDASVLIDVLNNDSDSESLLQPSSTTVVTAPLNGQTSINTANGVITYTPNTNYNGSDSFSYTVADQQGAVSALATVNITVNGINDLPMAVNDLVATAEDTDITFSILDNDSDIDVSGNLAINTIDTATVNIVSSTSSGSLTVVTSAMVIDDPSLSEGQVIYSPSANFNGSDSFTYTVTDTLGGVSNNATATINVTGTNDTPVAVDDTAQTDEDIAVVIEVLSNDSDIEDGLDSTSVREVSAPLHGTLTINAVTGAITYTPEPDFHGSDSFSYSVMDIDNATSNAATVALTINSINDAPVAVDNTVVLFEDSTNLINALGNDNDVDTALDNSHIIDPTTVMIVSQPASGLISVDGVSGEISYTPAVNFNGSDSFTYTVKDSASLVSNIATINLTITPVNDFPLANDDTASLDEDSSVSIDLLYNDQDIDGSLDQSSLVITYNGIACTSSPCQLGFGTVTDNVDGTVTYLPNANYVGGDSFSYTIDDNEAGRSNAASVGISVNNVNDVPTIDSAPVTYATEDGEFRYTLDGALFSDVDTEDNLTVTVEGLPIWLSFNSDTLTFTGTPTNDDVGDIILTVSVTDGNSDPVSQIFTLTVVNQNDAPLAANDTVSRDNWLAVDINVLANDIDVDGDNLIILAASVGSSSVNWTDTLLTYTPVEGFTGSAVIEYQVSDNNGGVDSALVFVDIVVPDNLFPVISVPADIEVNADALATRVDLGVATALDNAGNPLAVSLVDGTTFFQPGVTTAYWQTNDSDGLTSIASQLVKVNPLVSLDKDQTVLEGYAVTVDVHLNGLAPVYPLSIPYMVSGSAEQGVDHDLLDGEVVIESGTEGAIRFNVLSDDVFDDQETVVIALSELINLGSNSVHTLTISEQNIAPAVELTVSQAGSERFVVNLDDGVVLVEAEVIHPDLENQYSYQWTNLEQILTDSDNLDASFSFDPAGLAVGIYHLELLVTDLDDPTFSGSEQVTMLLEQSPIVLTDSDSDADGIPDNVEGLTDTDSDGIPDYLDAISECNVIQESLDSSNDFLVEGEPGVCLRLGDLALAGTTGGILIIDATTENPDATNTGGIFDFIAYELPVAGQTYQIVLPQLKPIPANPIYRKTNSDGLWVDFAETTTDLLWSVAGEPGYCPPPGDDSWEPGLVEGYWCVQLTIKDGGDNDADGLANNTIVDPSGVAVAVSSNNQPVAMDDVAQTRLDIPLTLDVLANDSDIDGNTLVINSANAAFGSVSIVDNQLYYEPTSGFFGVDTIVYGISDGQGGSGSATLTVTVAVNQAPVAVNDIANTVSGQDLIIAVLDNDSDPEGDSIVVISASAENGSVTINADNTLSYVSDSGFIGTDTISYRIRDAFGAETSGLVEVTVATATSTVKLKTSGGGALIWLLLIGFSLLTYRQVTNKMKGTR